ncbi:hypothetical protein NKG05_18420 [Oerskovia sp. M15]
MTAAADEHLAEDEGWSVDPTQSGPIELAGRPAYRTGDAHRGCRRDGHRGRVRVTQIETIVEVSTPAGTTFVFITESFATEDVDGPPRPGPSRTAWS